MSIVLVVLPGAPKPTNEAIQAEKELNATIERRIKGKRLLNHFYSLFFCTLLICFFFLEIFETTNDVQFSDVLNKLLALNIEGLPPGGGLASKLVKTL